MKIEDGKWVLVDDLLNGRDHARFTNLGGANHNLPLRHLINGVEFICFFQKLDVPRRVDTVGMDSVIRDFFQGSLFRSLD